MFSIRNKLIIAIVVVAVLDLAFTANSLLAGSHERGQLQRLYDSDEERSLIQDLQLQTANVWQFLTDASLTQNQSAIDKEGRMALDKALADLDAVKKLERHEIGRAHV